MARYAYGEDLIERSLDYIDHPETPARVAEIEELKKQLNGADRFTLQERLMPYEVLLPERFRGKNERGGAEQDCPFSF